MIQYLNPSRAKRFSSPNIQTACRTHPASYSFGTRVLLHG